MHDEDMKKMRHTLRAGKEAVLRYQDGKFSVLKTGDHVICAVTGQAIPLDDLCYWNVELQEAYATAEASLVRVLAKREKEAKSSEVRP